MKKGILMAIALLLFPLMGTMAQEAESQVGKFSIIPRVGVGLYNWSNCSLNVQDGQSMKSKYQAGFLGGVDVEYRATKEIGVSLGAYYAQQGFRFSSYQTENQGSVNTTLEGYNNIHAKIGYVQVPLLVRAYVTRNLSLLLGVQAGFRCGDANLKMDYTKAVIDKNDEVTVSESETIKSEWPTKKVDVSIPIGVAYEYMGVMLDLRYNLGLTNVSDISRIKDTDGEPYIRENCKSKGITLTVGYRFTL